VLPKFCNNTTAKEIIEIKKYTNEGVHNSFKLWGNLDIIMKYI